MDKEELLLRYECEGGEDLYAEAKPKFEEAPGTPGPALDPCQPGTQNRCQ